MKSWPKLIAVSVTYTTRKRSMKEPSKNIKNQSKSIQITSQGTPIWPTLTKSSIITQKLSNTIQKYLLLIQTINTLNVIQPSFINKLKLMKKPSIISLCLSISIQTIRKERTTLLLPMFWPANMNKQSLTTKRLYN